MYFVANYTTLADAEAAGYAVSLKGIGDGSVVFVPSVHFVLTVAIETGLPRRSCVAPRNDNDRSTTLRFDRCHCEEAERL